MQNLPPRRIKMLRVGWVKPILSAFDLRHTSYPAWSLMGYTHPTHWKIIDAECASHRIKIRCVGWVKPILSAFDLRHTSYLTSSLMGYHPSYALENNRCRMCTPSDKDALCRMGKTHLVGIRFEAHFLSSLVIDGLHPSYALENNRCGMCIPSDKDAQCRMGKPSCRHSI